MNISKKGYFFYYGQNIAKASDGVSQAEDLRVSNLLCDVYDDAHLTNSSSEA